MERLERLVALSRELVAGGGSWQERRKRDARPDWDHPGCDPGSDRRRCWPIARQPQPVADLEAAARSRPAAAQSARRAPPVRACRSLLRSSVPRRPAGYFRSASSRPRWPGTMSAGGAAAISVLTDEPFFQGSLGDLDVGRAVLPTAEVTARSSAAKGLRHRPLSDRRGAGARRRCGAADRCGFGRRGAARNSWLLARPGAWMRWSRSTTNARWIARPRLAPAHRNQQPRSEDLYCRSQGHANGSRRLAAMMPSSLPRAEYSGPSGRQAAS